MKAAFCSRCRFCYIRRSVVTSRLTPRFFPFQRIFGSDLMARSGKNFGFILCVSLRETGGKEKTITPHCLITWGPTHSSHRQIEILVHTQFNSLAERTHHPACRGIPPRLRKPHLNRPAALTRHTQNPVHPLQRPLRKVCIPQFNEPEPAHVRRKQIRRHRRADHGTVSLEKPAEFARGDGDGKPGDVQCRVRLRPSEVGLLHVEGVAAVHAAVFAGGSCVGGVLGGELDEG